jgi:hypothetical protein
MQLHIRGQGNHVIDCEDNESVGKIKVSYLYFSFTFCRSLFSVLYWMFSLNI